MATRTISGPGCWKAMIGRLGEEAAADFYLNKGYRVLARNWRAGRRAEVDLIVEAEDRLIVFVEIKTRCLPGTEGDLSTSGFQSVDWRKRKKLSLAAGLFLAQNRLPGKACRFDVVVIHYERIAGSKLINHSAPLHITHVADAFSS